MAGCGRHLPSQALASDGLLAAAQGNSARDLRVRPPYDKLCSSYGGVSSAQLPFHASQQQCRSSAIRSIDTPLTVSTAATARDIVYVGTQSGLFFSDDSGQRWQSRPLPSAGAVMVTAVNPLDARDIAIVVVGEEGIGRVHRSADGGTTWTAR